MSFTKVISIYSIIMIVIFLITIISIVIIAINSIIISSRLKMIHYKLIDIDLHSKDDTSKICNEIRKINL